ncbi:STAS domain-containing protein [Lichenibacterium minor]|jgi:anti-anti-sigma regulatory factor|uniref:STAS domain-containing protein n=1 Tax=Lichenibacterium minor TaxID=2316528 RepID=A0A4Q2U6Y5_9HYPH|nr:STAS domain-containing protein [Lichenibacterium minor]RYC32150.1 STAS domain-containing protein [Lichenibacterium minor]
MTDDVHTELITGDALLAGADDLQGRLGALLATGRPIRLDLSGVTAADVSFVQLMVSASLTAERAGQSLVLTGFSPKLRVTFEKAGVPVDPTAGRITLN